MKQKIIKKIIGILTMLAIVLIMVSVAKRYKKEILTAKVNGENTGGADAGDLILWYGYPYYADYIDDIIQNYEKLTKKKIKAKCVSANNMLDAINKAEQEDTEVPDLYIIGSENIEKAYLLGLAKENSNTGVYNKSNFYEAAIDAVTYRDRLYGYPIAVETAVFVYNKKYFANPPETFEDIMAFADNFDAAGAENPEYGGIESILLWNANSVIYNYEFMGQYVSFEGHYSDGDSRAVFDRENMIGALKKYKAIYDYFSIGNAAGDYEKVVDNFAGGKIVFTILNIESLRELDDSDIEYGICAFPKIDASLQTAPLMITDAVIINPYSAKTADAEKFATYITRNSTYKMYEMMGLMPAKKISGYHNEEMNSLQEMYKSFSSLPKMIKLTDYWLKAENLFKAINADGNIEELADAFMNDIDASLANTSEHE